MKIKPSNIILILAILVSSIFITSCGKNLSLSNPDIQKLTDKAQKLMQEGNFEGAIGRLQSINDLNPNLAENHYNLGIAYYKTNQYEKALDSLNKSINLDKDLKDAYYTMAVIQEELAIQETEELEKIEDNKEERINKLIKITKNYKNARENFTAYLNFIGPTPEREGILEKVNEFNKKIKKYTEILTELEIEEE